MKKIVACLLVLALCLSSVTLAEGTWVCPNCGEVNEAEYSFCGECGTGRPEENWFCPNCGKENNGNFCTACGTARPGAEPAEEPAREPVKVPAKTYRVGDIVTMGEYAGEPIDWQVLNVKSDGTCVLLSVKGLDVRQYHTRNVAVTWETCSLRAWLNGEFYDSVFSADEKEKINLTHLKNPDNKRCNTRGGNDTQDYVYLLSVDDLMRYFNVDPYGNVASKWESKELICYPTFTAYVNGANSNPEGACWWWLRTPANDAVSACRVGRGGRIHIQDDFSDTIGTYVTSAGGCIRPVIEVMF